MSSQSRAPFQLGNIYQSIWCELFLFVFVNFLFFFCNYCSISKNKILIIILVMISVITYDFVAAHLQPFLVSTLIEDFLKLIIMLLWQIVVLIKASFSFWLIWHPFCFVWMLVLICVSYALKGIIIWTFLISMHVKNEEFCFLLFSQKTVFFFN